ncbi:hypothetical protein IWZ03DRAFT_187666 [Phyllosticta citriasiana]|uniref:Uncharacterized protein n=1 Tax=Phyllosticta citriasiana TaxID=595635 RepID=A0ABR1KJS0_9PEZI
MKTDPFLSTSKPSHGTLLTPRASDRRRPRHSNPVIHFSPFRRPIRFDLCHHSIRDPAYAISLAVTPCMVFIQPNGTRPGIRNSTSDDITRRFPPVRGGACEQWRCCCAVITEQTLPASRADYQSRLALCMPCRLCFLGQLARRAPLLREGYRASVGRPGVRSILGDDGW